MEHIIEQLTSNPLHLAIAAILVIILAIGIIKKVIKLVLILAIAAVAFVGYLHFTGQKVPTNAEELKKAVSEKVEEVVDKLEESEE